MTLWHLVTKEIIHRKLNFALGLLSVVVAVGCLVGALTLLKVHDVRTQWLLAQKETETKARMDELNDEVRKAMLRLGFNLVILPRDQNLGDWYAEDYASKCMPEEYAHQLAQSGIVTIRHLLPSLQQKVKWPERKRTIILIGTRGEVPDLHKSPRRPLVQPVAEGTAAVGYELHQSLGLKEGDKIKLLGTDFTVATCYPERGSKDDITIWICLREAQELLDKRGMINAILAVECVCPLPGIADFRAEITRILPDTQVIEQGSKALARAEARIRVMEEGKAAIEAERQSRARLRRERERFASVLLPVVMVACAVWIAFLAFGNVRERRGEIGILRALGLRSRQILVLFMSRAIVMGLAGGVLGCMAGFLAGRHLGTTTEAVSGSAATFQALFDPTTVVLALLLAPFLAGVGSWIPAIIAAQDDPAEILRDQ